MIQKNTNIEDLVKNTFQDFEADVRPDAWTTIQSQLKPSGSVAAPKANPAGLATGKLVTMVASVVVTAGAVVYMALPDSPSNTNIKTIPTTALEIPVTPQQEVIPAEIPAKVIPSVTANPIVPTAPASKLNPTQSEEMSSIATTNTGKTPSPVLPENAIPEANFSSANNSQSQNGSSASNDSYQNNKPASDPVTTPVTPVPTEVNEPEAVESSRFSDVAVISNRIPNVFTPNNDGQNDEFTIAEQCKGLKSLRVEIVDMRGKLIHSWEGQYGFWDGKLMNGERAPSGSYFYIITGEGTDNKPLKPLKGSLTLSN